MERLTLPADELRVLGCLVEKQLTTPQQYPLTLNALTLACNQSSNREPVLSFSEGEVESAVTSAKARGLARFVHPSHGRSAIRFRHLLDEALGLDERQLALVAVLFLRGPQTPGELRARTERMAEFSSLGDIEDEIEALSNRPVPLVERLPRQPGHKEARFAHLLGDGVPVSATVTIDAYAAASDDDERDVHLGVPSNTPPGAPLGPTTHELAAEVENLRAQVDDLRRALDDLRSELGA